MCVHQVLYKKNIFCSLREKEKNYLVISLSFSTEFCPFYTRHMTNHFFMKRLCKRLAHEDVRAKFLFHFF
jgi:hypothetical protein